MSLSIGIVGLPNVGKSTLFNALVKTRQAAASNFAFTTIDPNVGIVEVPDQRLQRLYDIVVGNMSIGDRLSSIESSIVNSSSTNGRKTNNVTNDVKRTTNNQLPKIIPATVKFIDIAGLVKEAHKGEGLGNKFLAHIRETDAICMVLRCFEDSNVMHVAGKIDPKDDFETIKTELELADLQSTEKLKNKETKEQRNKETEEQRNLFEDKPVIYAANVGEKDAALSPEEIIKKFNLGSLIADRESLIVISAKVEQDLIDLEGEEQAEYLRSMGLEKSGLDRLIQSAYHTLGLQSFFTAGPKEVRAWTIKIGDTAPVAAGKIHTDFAKGFIKANVISYKDFIQYGGEQGAKEAGRLRQEGKDYVVKDGDIIEFLFNV